MSDLVVEFLKNVNIIQLIATGIMIWFFYNRLCTKIEKTEEKQKTDIEKLGERQKTEIEKLGERQKIDMEKLGEKIEKLEERQKADMEKLEERQKADMEKLGDKIEDIDRRLCRIEGSLSTHGHCLFNQRQPEKRAE